MFQRFTDRARKVMALANQEAMRFNHEYIGTEHILLGLVKEGNGVGANVLKNLGLDLPRIRREVEQLVRAGRTEASWGKLPQTPRAKMVLEYAIEESCKLNHTYIGTEHLLLGLLRETDGVAAQVLINLGVKLSDARAGILKLLGSEGHSAADAVAGAAQPTSPGMLHGNPPTLPEPYFDGICKMFLRQFDPFYKFVSEQMERAGTGGAAADEGRLRDAMESHFTLKKKALRHLVERDMILAAVLNAAAERLPADPVTPGRFVLAVLAAYPQLAERLGPYMGEIRRACEEA